ncbi:MAG: DUF4359 domain-containing protein [Oscillatoriales cyanobacterium RM1_1_9]|nr:DUF4359 domain-containing protein [Oscillatoriales cyanobacterium SM2_3_0]NJO44888.1 DUF4359 domain-containing protein [Oscillatoriales cyanobacterium RM2_1_1]NJO72229.1 DUF4359 domain-containing protein [Oscillatoriales cyanobacterium RM1_1_9]
MVRKLVDISEHQDAAAKKGKSNLGGCLSKAAIALAILAGTMAFTNPSEKSYLNYASNKLAQEVKQNWCKESELPEFLKNFSKSIVNFCSSVVTDQRQAIEGYLDKGTQRQNAVLFSIYTTDVFDRRYKTVGAFGHFLTFSSKKLDQVDIQLQPSTQSHFTLPGV